MNTHGVDRLAALRSAALLLQEEQDDSEVVEPSRPEDQPYQVPSTGAVVTLDSAKIILLQYCGTFPADAYFLPKPDITFSRTPLQGILKKTHSIIKYCWVEC